ncbi:MAG: Na(+)-translocating NADH-quinone reductase subunit A [Oceanospirillaceae bacterium]|jgi:Na+-transporting NADH:ubiquinone oxidoreductase subunit A|nr:Na(+)-translocating NADH-quinone reductase subunit A [Oceanospirillaceae bacterium]MBT4443933.1 Na(+)-translocating NADH-quinone reductase subunit A [Oceanospirillaceae bacterium]MBT6076507.1 Na(+)-translocating NADH-quinone reductase subunit A [Oceanospirillaceae bacterium]
MIKIRRGLDLPLSGAPQQNIEDAVAVSQVAVIGADYVAMKPTMAVRVGDRVKLGQVLFSDKKTPGVHFTAPAAGVVSAINRGAQRVLQSVVIDIDGDDAVEFATCAATDLVSLTTEQVAQNLQASGLWAALRTRPFSKVPAIDSKPSSIFVTAIDTHPLAADPAPIIASQQDAFAQGLQLLTKLTDGPVFVCTAADTQVPQVAGTQIERFEGVHPAGLASTHIHMLDPVSATKTVWAIGYQDVIAFAQLFATGKLPTERVVALAGPMVTKPRLLRTRVGASTVQLIAGETAQGEFENRVISGSVLGGNIAAGTTAFLGRYNNQITVLEEGKKREFMGWLAAGNSKHSVLNIFSSAINRARKIALNTSTNGSQRAMVPVGQFEQLMPLDILPTQLLRSLVVGDIVNAQELGCLELEEADLALMTYACAGKYEYGTILRDVLTRIEKEC